MRSSIRQVAALAGVSHVTVVNILRGRDSRASAETRERVLAAARELNYVPVAQPASQRRHIETRIIGLVFDQFNIDETQLGLSTFRGLREGAVEHNYDLLTLCRNEPNWMLGGEELQFLDRRCDGFIFVGPYKRRAVLDAVVAHGIPLVSCFNTDVPEGVPVIQPDDETAMRLAVGHLVQQGHGKIAHLAGPDSHSDARQRREAFEKATRDAGLGPCYVQQGRAGEWWPSPADMKQLLRQHATAVVCVNDAQALELWRVADEMGLCVPQEISIIGVDNIPEGVPRGLSSLAYSPVEIGRLAVDSLVTVMSGQPAPTRRFDVDVHLIERNSVACLRGTAKSGVMPAVGAG